MSRDRPRSMLRGPIASVAFALAAGAAAQPWYADLQTVVPQAPADTDFSGGSVLGYLNLYAVPEPPSWLPAAVVVLKVLVLAAAAAVVAAALMASRGGTIIRSSALVVVAIAAGASVYVRVSNVVLRDDGLTILWAAAIALSLLAAASPARRATVRRQLDPE